MRLDAVCADCLGTELKNPQNLAEPLSSCNGCTNTYLHSTCANTASKSKCNIQLLQFVEAGNKWFCDECTECVQCNMTNKGPCLIDCSECHKNFHMLCMKPSFDKNYKKLWR